MLIDSHCHINFPDLMDRMPEILENAKKNDVTHMLCVSVDLESFPQVIQLAHQYPHIFASVGVHPCYENAQEPDCQLLTRLADDAKVVAIGETGLDYFRIEDNTDMRWQQDRFRCHIEAAKITKKPLIIHTREAQKDTLSILRTENAQNISHDGNGVMHCFAEDWEFAKKSLDLGFYISFSGIVTFKNATQVQEVAKKCPLDRILIETDAPYLAPTPLRGKLNEPAYVKYTAQHIAQLKGIEYEELARITTQNFFSLFSQAQ